MWSLFLISLLSAVYTEKLATTDFGDGCLPEDECCQDPYFSLRGKCADDPYARIWATVYGRGKNCHKKSELVCEKDPYLNITDDHLTMIIYGPNNSKTCTGSTTDSQLIIDIYCKDKLWYVEDMTTHELVKIKNIECTQNCAGYSTCPDFYVPIGDRPNYNELYGGGSQ